MASHNLRQWFSVQVHSPQNDKLMTGGDHNLPEKMSMKDVLCRVLLALIIATYGAILVTLLVRSFTGEEQPENPTQQFYPPQAAPPPTTTTRTGHGCCNELLQRLDAAEVQEKLSLGRWILQEAYSTDSIDQYALSIAQSSWAEFYNDTNTGTLNLTMAHMLRQPRNKTINCVYHHFHDLTLTGNELHLDLTQEFNSSATFTFLKACNECLVMTGIAHVPNYPPLTYLLVYGLRGQLNEFFLKRTRQQAECLNFAPPPPAFHYNGDVFCPENWSKSYENSVSRRSRGPGCPFNLGIR